MFQKKKPKRSLDLKKEIKKEKEGINIKIEEKSEEEETEKVEDPVVELIGTLKNTIEVSQFDPVGSSEENSIEENSSDEQSQMFLENPKTLPKEDRRKFQKKKMSEAASRKGKEIGEFIKKHPSFKIENLIDSFELIDLIEHGLNIPQFHLEYHFPEYPKIQTGIDLKPIPKDTPQRNFNKPSREIIAVNDDLIFEIYMSWHIRVFGTKSYSFKLKDKVDRVKKVNKTIFMFHKDHLIAYDLVRLQKWGVSATDVTGNNLGEFITLEEGRFIKVYKDDLHLHTVELNVEAEAIASYYDRKVIVRTTYKVLFILDLDTLHAEIISGPPDEKAEIMEVQKDILVIKTSSRLYFIDLKNKKKALARFTKEFKCTIGDVVRTYDFGGNFRYFDLVNPRNNTSEKYKEIIKTFDALNNRVYLLIDDTIKVYESGVLIDEIDASIQKNDYDFTNVIFTESDFERWKKAYKRVEKEEGEFLPNDLNLCLKGDVDKILGREKIQKLNFGSQKSSGGASQKKKKGGF